MALLIKGCGQFQDLTKSLLRKIGLELQFPGIPSLIKKICPKNPGCVGLTLTRLFSKTVHGLYQALIQMQVKQNHSKVKFGTSLAGECFQRAMLLC